MGKITNVTGVSLPLAVWLAGSDYDFVPDERSISATSLLKPLRQIVLGSRLTEETAETPDVADYFASRLGHAIHDSIEKSWHNAHQALERLGYPDHIIKKIVINPTNPTPDQIPVWMEQRSSRVVNGYKISGKFDMICEGQLHDFKSTSTYAWTSGSKDEDYRLQGSIYRWLNQDKVTDDTIYIHFLFTDWQSFRAKQDPNYPQQRGLTHPIPLMSIDETEAWIYKRTNDIKRLKQVPQEDLPRCSDKELWRDATTWKYYSDPAKLTRASKNFNAKADAYAHLASKGGKGVVHEFPGKVKACNYCPAFPICTQKDEYDLS